MKANLSSLDRVIRVIAAIVFVILYATGVVSGTWGIVLLVVGGVFILTSLVSFCPIYYALGLKSLKNKEHAAH